MVNDVHDLERHARMRPTWPRSTRHEKQVTDIADSYDGLIQCLTRMGRDVIQSRVVYRGKALHIAWVIHMNADSNEKVINLGQVEHRHLSPIDD